MLRIVYYISREFYLYAIKKVARDLCATESWVRTYMPLTQTFETLMPFRRRSVRFLPLVMADMWDRAW
jgi:hypothetical protein